MVERLLVIQHRLNPLHVYCRLLDKGLSRRSTILICRSYEILIFMWVRWVIKTVIYLAHLIGRNSMLQKEIRKN